MGMLHEGDVFATMIRTGDMVRVGTDKFGLPLFSHSNCFAKPFDGASPDLSRILHAISRPQTLPPRR